MPSAYDTNPATGKKGNPAKTADELKAKGLSASKKQARARARRAHARNQRIDAEIDLMYKPLDEWDSEELAQGVPRELWGKKKAGQLKWMPRAVHEQIVDRYQAIVKDEMRAMTPSAIRMLQTLLENDETDRKGKPLVSANVKLSIIQLLIEHVVGKPTQKIEADVSVKMQAMLAHVMVVPDEEGGEMTQGFMGLNVPTHYDGDDEDGE